MTPTNQENTQTAQRVKVGATGLAVIVLLIVLASAIINSASQETPVAVVGGSQANVVANLALTNDDAPPAASEPLAELGVAPSTATANMADGAAAPASKSGPARHK